MPVFDQAPRTDAQRSSELSLTTGMRESFIPDESTLELLHRECADLSLQSESLTQNQKDEAPDITPITAEDPRLKKITEKQEYIEKFVIPLLKEMSTDSQAYLRGLQQTSEQFDWIDRHLTDMPEINAAQQKDAKLTAEEYLEHAEFLTKELEKSKKAVSEALEIEKRGEELAKRVGSRGSVADLDQAQQLLNNANEKLAQSFNTLDKMRLTPDRARSQAAYSHITVELEDSMSNMQSTITWCQRAQTAGNIAANFVPVGKAAQATGFVAKAAVGFARSMATSTAFNTAEEVGHVTAGDRSVIEAFSDLGKKTLESARDSSIGAAGNIVGGKVTAKLLGESGEALATNRKVIGNLVVGASEAATKSTLKSAVAYNTLLEDFDKSIEGQPLTEEERELRFEKYAAEHGFTITEIAADILVDSAQGAAGKGVGLGKAHLEGKASKAVIKVAIAAGEEITKQAVNLGAAELKDSI